MRTIQIRAAWNGHSHCQSCGIRQSALFSSLSETDFSKVHEQIDDLEFGPGAVLFEQGAGAKHVFTIRSGLVKLSLISSGGEEKILRVMRSGGLCGLDAMSTGVFGQVATALTPVSACRIPIALVEQLDRESPQLHSNLMGKWAETLRESESWFAELNTGAADQRVARYLIKMQVDAQGATEAEPQAYLFKREDMGSMLGLTLETVSRKLNGLHRDGVIELISRTSPVATLRNLARLREIAGL
jgi:CRP-like cAMP-binding protein